MFWQIWSYTPCHVAYQAIYYNDYVNAFVGNKNRGYGKEQSWSINEHILCSVDIILNNERFGINISLQQKRQHAVGNNESLGKK